MTPEQLEATKNLQAVLYREGPDHPWIRIALFVSDDLAEMFRDRLTALLQVGGEHLPQAECCLEILPNTAAVRGQLFNPKHPWYVKGERREDQDRA